MRFFWALVFVAAAAGGVYLADRMVLAPSREMQRQLAEKEAQIRALTERNQALEAAIRLLRYAERRARLVVLDQTQGTEGQIPQSYAAERAPTAFERDLWARFLELANNPEEAKRRGVRALHGEAVSTKVRKDRVYSITLRSTGELTIQPIK